MAPVVARKKGNVGVAISANSVVAWLPLEGDTQRGERWERQIDAMAPTASGWPELEVALRALAADTGGGTLFLALVPPLVQIRSLQLPPVDPDDASRIVSSGAAKYFLGAREAQVVSVSAREGSKGEATEALACAAPERIVEAIRDAAEGAGWKVGRIVPAHSAWLAAADHVWAKSDALVDHGRVVVFSDDRTEVIFKDGGHASSFRHVRGADSVGAKLAQLLATHGGTAPGGASRNGLRPVAVIGSDLARRQLAPSLRDRGLHPLEPEGIYQQVLDSAPLAAAHFAPLTEDLELVSEQARTLRDLKLRRVGVVVGIVAAVLVAASAGVHYWGMQRELAGLQERRDSVRAAVAQVLDTQNKIGTMGAPIAALDSLRAASVQWSAVLSDISQQLPSDGFVVTFRAREDTLNLNGRARDAGAAIEGLRRVPSLFDVRQAGQIRQELDTATYEVVARARRVGGGGGVPK